MPKNYGSEIGSTGVEKAVADLHPGEIFVVPGIFPDSSQGFPPTRVFCLGEQAKGVGGCFTALGSDAQQHIFSPKLKVLAFSRP